MRGEAGLRGRGLPTERSRATAYRAVHTEVSRLACETKQLPVLVIDEAHHLRNDVLVDLRLLTLCRTTRYAAGTGRVGKMRSADTSGISDPDRLTSPEDSTH